VQEFDAAEAGDDRSVTAGAEDCLESEAAERRGDDRRCHNEYVFRDKRSGFDRRRQQVAGVRGYFQRTLVHLRDNPRTLQVLLLVVNALNLADFGLTVNALANGASEANPVMASLFRMGPIWAGIFKTAAVLVATALVWECRRYRKALLAGVAMFLVFAAIFIYHMVGIALLS
jgi:hypothetical protein